MHSQRAGEGKQKAGSPAPSLGTCTGHLPACDPCCHDASWIHGPPTHQPFEHNLDHRELPVVERGLPHQRVHAREHAILQRPFLLQQVTFFGSVVTPA